MSQTSYTASVVGSDIDDSINGYPIGLCADKAREENRTVHILTY